MSAEPGLRRVLPARPRPGVRAHGPLLRPLHGRHRRVRPDALAASGGGATGAPDAHHPRAYRAPRQDVHRAGRAWLDFLGYHITPHGLSVAEETLRRFVARVTRLYEHERSRPDGSAPLGLY